jgi:putative transposase
VIAYNGQHRGRFGVEPISSVLQFAPRTYYAAKARPPSARALRDVELKPEIARVLGTTTASMASTRSTPTAHIRSSAATSRFSRETTRRAGRVTRLSCSAYSDAFGDLGRPVLVRFDHADRVGE